MKPVKKKTPAVRKSSKVKSPLKEPTPWEGVPDETEGLEGFVYLITHKATGKKYIGRKYFWAKTRVRVAGRKNRKRKTSTSDWAHYKSSCKELKEQIVREGVDAFRYEILSCHATRAKTNYEEVRLQFQLDTLYAKLPHGDYEFYNSNILSRYFRPRSEKE